MAEPVAQSGESSAQSSAASPNVRSRYGGWFPAGFLGLAVGVGLAASVFSIGACEHTRITGDHDTDCSDEQAHLRSFALEVTRTLAGVLLGSSLRTGL
jgi:hypothetical protein